jgi:hypothetical protein
MVLFMDYDYYSDKIGTRFNIVEGNLVEAENGMFPVTESFQSPSIYVNKLDKKVSLISPKNSYIGRTYGLRQADCVAICFSWHDDNKGTDLMKIYKNTPNREFYNYYLEGMAPWFLTHGFQEVQTMEIGDMLVYENVPETISHIAIYLGNNKILQHMPNKLSGVDTLDSSKVRGIYRHA